MSSRPKRRKTSSMRECTVRPSAMSPASTRTSSPRSPASAAACSGRWTLSATRAPLASSRSAAARPRPRAAPVTSATRPESAAELSGARGIGTGLAGVEKLVQPRALDRRQDLAEKRLELLRVAERLAVGIGRVADDALDLQRKDRALADEEPGALDQDGGPGKQRDEALGDLAGEDVGVPQVHHSDVALADVADRGLVLQPELSDLGKVQGARHPDLDQPAHHVLHRVHGFSLR